MTIEITTQIGCRFNCKYCPQDKLLKAYKGERKLSYNSFVKYIDRLFPIETIHFSGFCEPFLNGEIYKMIEYAKDYKIKIFTNALCKIDAGKIKKCKLIIHVYDDQMKLRKDDKSNFIENIKNFNKLDIDYEFIVVGNNKLNNDQESVIYSSNRYVYFQKIVSRAGNLGSEKVKIGRRIYCEDDRQKQNVVLPNGDVIICCMDYSLNHIIGNLNKERYVEILAGDKYRGFLNKMRTNTTGLCNKCFRGVICE